MNTIKAQCTLVDFTTYERQVTCTNIYGEWVTRPILSTYVDVGLRVTAINEENFVMVRGDTHIEHAVSFTEFEPQYGYEYDLDSIDSWLDEYAF